MNKYPLMKISLNFLSQEHIVELDKMNLLSKYEKLLLTLEESNFSFTHERKGFLKALSKYSNISEKDLWDIISVLVKYSIFHYKYDKVGYFKEKHLFYDNGKCAYKERDASWEELVNF